jgi:four helix bundle protein
MSVARGSAGELRTQLYLACKLGYVSAGRTRELVARAKEVSRMATGLIGRLRKAESD